MSWDLPTPFVIDLQVGADDIDGLGHANNAVYVSWLERCAWRHSQHLGLDLAEYRRLDRAMAVLRHEIDYRNAALPGDQITGTTWVGEHYGPRFDRFVTLRQSGGERIFAEAKTTWCLLDARTMRPARIPDEVLVLL